ncbi:MAG TPA: S9 family peptidase, partial [Casimicrobiaceae bacterium]|nr:S9 family peptidase [Casimicrobiaceae bacterium]
MTLFLSRLPLVLATLAFGVAVAPLHAEDALPPNPHLRIEGVPAIPAALAAKVAPYTEFRPRRVASWHPKRRELIVASRIRNTVQLQRVKQPGAQLEPLTDYADPVRGG